MGPRTNEWLRTQRLGVGTDTRVLDGEEDKKYVECGY